MNIVVRMNHALSNDAIINVRFIILFTSEQPMTHRINMLSVILSDVISLLYSLHRKLKDIRQHLGLSDLNIWLNLVKLVTKRNVYAK